MGDDGEGREVHRDYQREDGMSLQDKQKLMRVIREILSSGTDLERAELVKWMIRFLEENEQ